MTASFKTRMSATEKVVLMTTLFSLILWHFQGIGTAYAQSADSKKGQVFEIKSQTQNTDLDDILDPQNKNEEPVKLATAEEIMALEAEMKKTELAKASGKIFWTEEQIKEYACPKFGKDCKTFIAVLKAENGTHECTRRSIKQNRNGSYDWGLAQINDRATPGYTVEQFKDCKFNIDLAHMKYKERKNTFRAWAAYNSGAYKKHLRYVN